MIHLIDFVTRISISRSGGQNAALLQVRETNRWETKATRLFESGMTGDKLISAMKEVHEKYLQDQQYQAGLADGYH